MTDVPSGAYRARCHHDGCPRGPRWLYIHEYNQDEGYVRRRACDLHLPGPEHPGRADAEPLDPARFPDVRLPSGVGWPGAMAVEPPREYRRPGMSVRSSLEAAARVEVKAR
jgi:hypothetical protein